MGLFDFLNPVGRLGMVMDELTGADKAREQIDKATKAQTEGTRMSLQSLRDMYNTGLSLQQPQIEQQNRALATLASAIYGGDQEYMDPNYRPLTEYEREQLNRERRADRLDPYGNDRTYYRNVRTGEVSESAPMLSAFFQLQDNPALQYRNQQLEKNMGRYLRGIGRSNSTYGMNSMGEGYDRIAADEWGNQLSRLSSLAGIGTAGANSAAGSSNALGQNMAGQYNNQANQLSNLYGQKGQLYTSYSPLNIALQAGKVAAAAYGG